MPKRTLPLSHDFIAAVSRAAAGVAGPFTTHWPMPGALGGIVSFNTFEQWQRFVEELSLHNEIPSIVAVKYARALKLFLLAWIDADLIRPPRLSAWQP
jgi:hypothetical protein